MLRKLSVTSYALLFFTLTLILSTVGMFAMFSTYHPSYVIYATKYSDKPTSYIAIYNPDRYVLEAISSGHSSVFNSLDSTQIDELTSDNLTWNIEYNGSYYGISILYGDNFPPFMLPQMLLGGIGVSGVAIAVICSYKAAIYIKRQK
jgi:hypothetical protein